MIKAKYLGDDFRNLTIGEVYDVVKYNKNADAILIDIGDGYGEDWYSRVSIPSLEPLFEDVTKQYRNDTIIEILS